MTDALQEARTLLQQLVDGARDGSLTPARLAGQLEQVERLIANTQDNGAQASAASTPALDEQAFLQEQAYFVSHAIHELRTPLTSIRGYADMLGQPALGPLSDMQRQFVDTIRSNSRRMEGLLTDVSDMAKIKGGTLRLNIKMDTFKNIAMMIEKNTRPLAESLNKSLEFEIPSGLPLLQVDGDLLAKAFTKLVENGLRYTPEDGGKVTVEAENRANTLVVRVRDNGIGMSPEELARLGTVYFRSENEQVRVHKGSGLGIPIAYGIIQLLGGTVEVESARGAGTTFTVSLPGMN
ncbi:MAG: HAMP domain-containing sensor histidine kinase [Chloroflexota bacterium]|nr:MAG: hypothetical protein DIU68_17305 [Chloroflexota bacterium]